jgi:hypothetical protein
METSSSVIGGSGSIVWRAFQNNRRIMPAKTRAPRTAAMSCPFWAVTADSSRVMLRSMSTKRNSTRMAPV